MTYHAPSNEFTVSLDHLQTASRKLLRAMAEIRKSANLPMQGYNQSGDYSPAEKACQRIVEAAQTLGINLGAENQESLDLRPYA